MIAFFTFTLFLLSALMAVAQPIALSHRDATYALDDPFFIRFSSDNRYSTAEEVAGAAGAVAIAAAAAPEEIGVVGAIGVAAGTAAIINAIGGDGTVHKAAEDIKNAWDDLFGR